MTEETTPMKIERFDIGAEGGDGLQVDPEANGDWVRYEDVEPIIARVRELEAAIREHKAECCTGYVESCDITEANGKLWAALGGEGGK